MQLPHDELAENMLCFSFNPFLKILGILASGDTKVGGGAWGHLPPPSQRRCPHLPPLQSEGKMAKISHFQQFYGFLPPSDLQFSPSMPPMKKHSGVATDPCTTQHHKMFQFTSYLVHFFS